MTSNGSKVAGTTPSHSNAAHGNKPRTDNRRSQKPSNQSPDTQYRNPGVCDRRWIRGKRYQQIHMSDVGDYILGKLPILVAHGEYTINKTPRVITETIHCHWRSSIRNFSSGLSIRIAGRLPPTIGTTMVAVGQYQTELATQ